MTSSRGLVLAILVAAAVRLYPIHVPYLAPEQELVPRAAVLATVRGDWQPIFLHHGAALVDALRVAYTAWYAAGELAGRYASRIDFLAAFVRDPLPFLIVGRLLVCVAGIVTVLLAARLATVLVGAEAAVGAALLLGVAFIHVRESHHVWYDVPAAAAAVACVIAAVRAVETGRGATLAVAAALAGVTVACRLSFFPIVVPLALAAWWSGAPTARGRLVRLLGVGAAALVTFAVLSPYSFLAFGQFLAAAHFMSGAVGEGRALPLGTLVDVGLGPVMPLLVLVGIAATVRTGRTAVVAAAFPILYALTLVLVTRVYARYLAPLAPFAAVYAAAGVVTVASVVPAQYRRAALWALVLLAGAVPAVQSVQYDRLLARRDTRQLAGDWIRAHVAPGTALTLPSANGYPNPVLPETATDLHLVYGPLAPALRRAGLGDPARTWPARYLTGVMGGLIPGWEPRDRWVVTASHPEIVRAATLPADVLARLERAGARPVARFEGFPEPLPPGVVFDPLDADYVPLRGFASLLRPGPNITIWEVPQKP